MAVRIINRSMDIPIPDRTVGYKGDNLVEIRTFELNRFYGDIDLSTFDFKLDTEINGTKNIIDLDKSVTEDKITLTWTVRESHVLNAGRMAIQLRAFSQGEEKRYYYCYYGNRGGLNGVKGGVSLTSERPMGRYFYAPVSGGAGACHLT